MLANDQIVIYYLITVFKTRQRKKKTTMDENWNGYYIYLWHKHPNT